MPISPIPLKLNRLAVWQTILGLCLLIGLPEGFMPSRAKAAFPEIAGIALSTMAFQEPPLSELPPPDLPPAIESAPSSALPSVQGDEIRNSSENQDNRLNGTPEEPSQTQRHSGADDELVSLPETLTSEPVASQPDDPGKSATPNNQGENRNEMPARDENLVRVQNEAPPVNSVSNASNSAGQTGGSIDLSQFRPGVQGVGLYVQVVSPPSANLQQDTTFRIIVKNAMQTQAFGVVVRDILPNTLEFVKSQPEASKDGSSLVWNLGDMAIGAEKTITVIAKPTQIGSLEHTTTVTCQTGTRARLIVQEPKIKVEQTLIPAKPLKGQPVQLQVAVSNPGTGVARDVAVVVRVSQGLQDGQGSRNFDQEIRRLGPGERMVLQPLTLNTIAGGSQSSEATASSPDVATPQPEAKSSQSIEVLEPKLKLTMAGPSQKYTNTEDIYELTLENPGTAPARGLIASVLVPDNKGVLKASREAKLDHSSRKINWMIDRLEPGEKRVLKFEYRVGAMGTYPFTADVRGESGLAEKQSVSTIVTGVADVDFQISEKSRIIDVGDTTDYIINIRNHGTKDAENVLISAELSENLKAIETDGHEGNVRFDPSDPKQATFPPIAHLSAGQEMTLVIRVQAVKPGLSSLRVFLHHEDLGSEKLEKQVVTPRVTDSTQITSKGAQPQG